MQIPIHIINSVMVFVFFISTSNLMQINANIFWTCRYTLHTWKTTFSWLIQLCALCTEKREEIGNEISLTSSFIGKRTVQETQMIFSNDEIPHLLQTPFYLVTF